MEINNKPSIRREEPHLYHTLFILFGLLSYSLSTKNTIQSLQPTTMAAATAVASKVSLKLLVDTKANRVLFAEASKDFIDFLFSTLSLPLGTIIRLLSKQEMVGSVGNVYQSIENLNENYIQPNQQKDTFLKPKSAISPINTVPLLPLDDVTPAVKVAKKSLYTCGYDYCSSKSFVTDDNSARCPSCRCAMGTMMTFVESPAKNDAAARGGGEGGFVKGVVTYMVMDDLTVMPLSAISSLTLLNKLNVKDVGVLEERVVDVGMDEGMKLLKESLQSKTTILTNVFLDKKAIDIDV